MKTARAIVWFTALIISSIVSFGCSNLRPAVDQTRYYVLESLPSAVPGARASTNRWAVGLGRVNLPDYLLRKPIASRKSNNEIQYNVGIQWAERLDKGMQRVLGANLNSLLGASNVVFSTWRRADVDAEVYVSVQHFESEEAGRVVLAARWRITSPGAVTTWHTGFSRIVKQGPLPATDPGGAVSTLGEALGELSREIVAALGTLSPSPSPATSSEHGRLES